MKSHVLENKRKVTADLCSCENCQIREHHELSLLWLQLTGAMRSWLLVLVHISSAAAALLAQPCVRTATSSARASPLVCAETPYNMPPSSGPPADTPAAPAAAAASPAVTPSGMSMPPESFKILVDDAAKAVDTAIADGQMLMEVEFPPVPTSKLDDSSLSAYDILAANLQFAVEFVKRLQLDDTGVPRRIALTLPDSAERQVHACDE